MDIDPEQMTRGDQFNACGAINTESIASMSSTEPREHRQIGTRSIETRSTWSTDNIRITEPRDAESTRTNIPRSTYSRKIQPVL